MTEKSTHLTQEAISALVDNEGSSFDVQRVLNALQHEPGGESAGSQSEPRASWQRYHLISQLARREALPDVSFDLSNQVRARIEQEEAPNVSLEDVPSKSLWWRDGLGKGAIAATVALGLIWGGQQYSGTVDSAAFDGAALAVNASDANSIDSSASVAPPGSFALPSPSVRTVSTGGARQSGGMQSALLPAANRAFLSSEHEALRMSRAMHDPALQMHLNRLVLEHAEQSSVNGSLGMIPLARVSKLETPTAKSSAENTPARRSDR